MRLSNITRNQMLSQWHFFAYFRMFLEPPHFLDKGYTFHEFSLNQQQRKFVQLQRSAETNLARETRKFKRVGNKQDEQRFPESNRESGLRRTIQRRNSQVFTYITVASYNIVLREKLEAPCSCPLLSLRFILGEESRKQRNPSSHGSRGICFMCRGERSEAAATQ